MANFFDKIKQSATKVTDKAQQTIELSKLTSQISAKKKEIDKLLHLIGGEAYHAFSNEDLMQAEPRIAQFSKEIKAIQEEIELLEIKVKELKNEKECTCGKVVPLDTKFCPVCGNKFEPQITSVDVIPEGTEVVVSECPVCHAALQPDAKFCESCGCKVVS
ncbi:zinc ribbon domain-containing protein [Paenibacillus albiflavus]|nr:zinc ribbon domain-containing protein [Paenibacillus albiflavus]